MDKNAARSLAFMVLIMKIKKLKKDLAGRYDLAELPDKINEIIDVLNNSFITDDPDTIYGKTVSADEILNDGIVLTDITCDTLVPLDNEHTLNSKITTAHETTVDGLETFVSEVFDNMMAEIEKNPLTNIKCPHCGESYYTELYSTSTAVYYPPIYKNGVNINPDRNTSTTHCKCLNCHKAFDI